MLISQAEYARKRGVSRQYVGQMVAKGIIQLVDKKVDVDQADVALAAIRDPARAERRPKHDDDAPAPVPGTDGNQSAAYAPTFSQSGNDLPTLLLKTRIKSEVERAKLLEIKAKVEAGKYVDADDVKLVAFNKARVVRDALMNIPERLAAVLAAETDTQRVHNMLMTELRTALEELSR